MNALESYVDSSSEPYLRSIKESIAWGWGAICKDNPFSSGFVSYICGTIISPDDYPLYRRGDKGLEN